MWSKFVKSFCTVRQLLIIFSLLVEQANCLTIATASITKPLLCPVKVTKVKKKHTSLYGLLCSLLVSLLISIDSLHGDQVAAHLPFRHGAVMVSRSAR